MLEAIYTFSIISTEMLEHLNVTADLLATATLSSTTINEICNQLVSTTWLFVDDNFSSPENGNLLDCFHKGILDIFRPHLLVLLSRVGSLQLHRLSREVQFRDGVSCDCLAE